MSLTSTIDLGLAIEQLRSHQLAELFTQSLGWDEPLGIEPIHGSNQQCVPIATREGVVVWQVSLVAKTHFDSVLRHQIYTALADTALVNTALADSQQGSPLVIFVADGGRRSLWCQSAYESALYVAGVPMALWSYRLQRLARGSQGLFPTIVESETVESEASSEGFCHQGEAFAALVEGLCTGITGLDSISQRRTYSVLTLQRLMFIQQIQQKGWLARDTWYLQVRFGEALQKGKNLFFETCLQPLYRCLSLPAVERPLALQQSIGSVPFLGQLFHTHWLEEKYAAIAIDDAVLEPVLGWLSEQMIADTLNPWMAGDSGYWLAQYWVKAKGLEHGVVCTPRQAREICDRTLDQLLLNRINIFAQPSLSAKQQEIRLSDAASRNALLPESKRSAQDETLNDFLFTADSRVCHRLIQEILPELQILDPHCGSGQLLVAFHQRLTEIASILTGYIHQTQDAQLKIWHSTSSQSAEGAVPEDSSDDKSAVMLKHIQERILKNNLYGVAETPEVVASAHFQLLLHLVATAQSAELIEPLVDLEFTVMPGNALVGFITVDEERFEQVNKTGADSVLQGNLLQPLAADSYQAILSEKDIALEHYQTRSQLLATAHSVPPYARAALLREEILTLDSRAQHKLDTLLLNHMSQQLGMRYRETQLTDKPRRRPLILSDMEQFSPFHWGYHFNAIVKRGGFDVVACIPRWGAFKPMTGEFLQQFEDLAEQTGVSQKTFKTSKQALAKGDVAIAAAWLAYQDRYVCVADYFARSDLYVHQTMPEQSRSQFFWEQLLVERCFNLLAPSGVGAAFVPTAMLREERGRLLTELFDGRECEALSMVRAEDEGLDAAVVVWEKS